MQYRWQLLPESDTDVGALASEAGVSPFLARLLTQRGLSDPVAARRFLRPRLQDLYDPYLMKDMDRVVARVLAAGKARGRVLVYGDYDVDGISATVVLRRALEMLGVAVDFYLPQRLEEGYGLKAEVVRQAKRDGCDLVISVDSGIRAFEACQAAREVDLDLIVTDHHLPDTTLPPAYAILNPKRWDCPYPDKNLAAVGVVFKLVQALFAVAGKEAVVDHFLKLVAIGTVADMVPVTGENRIIIRHGLERLADARNLGLKALLEAAGVSREVSLFDVGFKLAPRINAVTRMGGGREVVELFSVSDPGEAGTIVQMMNEKNAERQKAERGILAEIEERYRRAPQEFERAFMVISGEGWHRGVIGIVASRLVERFYRPALVLSSDGSVCQGSGRSIPGFHILEALDQCRDLLLQYGGHAQAVGCSVEPSLVPALAERLNEYAGQSLNGDALTPSLVIDSLLSLGEISPQLPHELAQLAPFGIGNPIPVFASKRVCVVGGPWILKDQHLKLQVGANGCRFDAVWWKNGSAAGTIVPGSPIDLAYTVDRETYQGREALILTIRDLRQA